MKQGEKKAKRITLDEQCIKDGGFVLTKAMLLQFLREDGGKGSYKEFKNYWGGLSEAISSYKRFNNLTNQLRKEGLAVRLEDGLYPKEAKDND